jgi:hypothetical protein
VRAALRGRTRGGGNVSSHVVLPLRSEYEGALQREKDNTNKKQMVKTRQTTISTHASVEQQTRRATQPVAQSDPAMLDVDTYIKTAQRALAASGKTQYAHPQRNYKHNLNTIAKRGTDSPALLVRSSKLCRCVCCSLLRGWCQIRNPLLCLGRSFGDLLAEPTKGRARRLSSRRGHCKGSGEGKGGSLLPAKANRQVKRADIGRCQRRESSVPTTKSPMQKRSGLCLGQGVE